MKTKITTLLLVFLISCTKDNLPQDKLPEATTTGANTAGCYINGQLLIAKDGTNTLTGFPIYGIQVVVGVNFSEPIIGDDYFSITIANLKDKKDRDYWISLTLNDMTKGVGNYIVGQSSEEYSYINNSEIMVRESIKGVSGKTFISSPNSGTITITRFDYKNGIYSGTFNATLYNKDNPSEKIQVTDGRFDIK